MVQSLIGIRNMTTLEGLLCLTRKYSDSHWYTWRGWLHLIQHWGLLTSVYMSFLYPGPPLLSIIQSPVLPCACGLVMASQDIFDDIRLVQYISKAQLKCHFLICKRDVEWRKVPQKLLCLGWQHRKLYREILLFSPCSLGVRPQAQVEDMSLDNGVDCLTRSPEKTMLSVVNVISIIALH